VRELVRLGGVKAFGVAESLERRQLHEILPDSVVGQIAAAPDICRSVGKERFRRLDALQGFKLRIRERVKMGMQTIDLLGIEHHIGFEEGDLLLFAFLALHIGGSINNVAAALPFRTLPPSSIACL
jgi:hypothetical protein